MYKQYLEVQSHKGGTGVFTSVNIPADMPIMEMSGSIVLDRDIPAKANIEDYWQIGPNTYLAPSGEVGDFIGHHCNPNCKLHVVGNRAILYSLYVIPANSEITVDYSTTSTDTFNTWEMKCKCNSYQCRKVISGFNTLDPATKAKYIEKNMVPLYILEPNLIKTR